MRSPSGASKGDYMRVYIKKFVDVEVKSTGIEFEVRAPDNQEQLGDCYLTMTGLIWCDGKTPRVNGVKVSWDDFMAICDSKESLRATIKAAKAVG